jgi:hypothetical protein
MGTDPVGGVMRAILVALLLSGCSRGSPGGGTPTPSEPGETQPSTSETGTVSTDTGPVGLHGTVPPVALSAPAFSSVVNQDVALVSRDDLLGHPTVMWFYPAATSGG